MAYYPKLSGGAQQRSVIDAFAGYNHNLRIRDGEFFDTKNLTTSRYPLLTSRDKRSQMDLTPAAYRSTKTYKVGEYCTLENVIYRCSTAINTAEEFTQAHWTQVSSAPANLQAIIAKDKLYWVDSGILYAQGVPTGLTNLQTTEETQMVSMGAYICIFPDKAYINTQNLAEYGHMEESVAYVDATVTYTMCHQDGTIYTDVTKSASEPANPANGAIWIDTGDKIVREYSTYSQTWVTVQTVYTRIDIQSSSGPFATLFKEYDGVNISGTYYDDLNGSKVLYGVGHDSVTGNDYIVVAGVQDTVYTQSDADITISRKVPDMDFVCEAQNRLWGCRYGKEGTKSINEIYCCALGDFKNWEQYLGVSTDSWRASCGSDGPWTGAINYMGTPTFFKENIIHQVSVSPVGAHQIGDLPARGVQSGCHKSLAVVNETLFYKSRSGVMAYQGGMPADVSQALGEVRYTSAAAGAADGQRYYISMKEDVDTNPPWHLFCYDAGKGLWMHEDDLHATGFAMIRGMLHAITADNRIVVVDGSVQDAAYVPEGDFDWSAETGLIHYEQNLRGSGAQPVRYVSRFSIRLSMDPDSWLEMFIEYDSSGEWEHCGHYRLPNTGAVLVPVRPRRCDHFRVKLKGHGTIRLYSMARVLEKGSDA